MWRQAGRWLSVILVAALVVLAVRILGVSLIAVPDDSACPVFLPGDRVTVGKASYGLRLFPMRQWGYVRLGGRQVERGEWVAFNDPSDGYPDTLCIDERPVMLAYCAARPGDSLWVDRKGRVLRLRPIGHRFCKVVELPRKYAYVHITPDNVRWYSHIINLHEGLESTVKGDSLFVDGHHVTAFRFGHDYYWMASASQENQVDSRTYGFVPDTHVIGRLRRVFYSWDNTAPWYARLRFHRTLMEVGREKLKRQKP